MMIVSMRAKETWSKDNKGLDPFKQFPVIFNSAIVWTFMTLEEDWDSYKSNSTRLDMRYLNTWTWQRGHLLCLRPTSRGLASFFLQKGGICCNFSFLRFHWRRTRIPNKKIIVITTSKIKSRSTVNMSFYQADFSISRRIIKRIMHSWHCHSDVSHPIFSLLLPSLPLRSAPFAHTSTVSPKPDL